MIRPIPEFGVYASILGFRKVRVSDVEAFLRTVRGAASPAEVQIFDADRVAGWRHLFFATVNALRAFKSGRNVSGGLAVEILIYASGQGQIDRAIEMLGVKESTSNLAVLIVGADESIVKKAATGVSDAVSGTVDEKVLEIGSEEKFQGLASLFGIAREELGTVVSKSPEEALTLLVIERGALLVAAH